MTLRDAVNRIAALEETQSEILEELRMLRRARARMNEDGVVALLEHIHDGFRGKTWASSDVLELAFGQPALRGAVVRCLGKSPTV
ncbi:MAG: hypothetical protein M3Q07_07535 [Pseudobdellovibrionaceae bacterium]|nr:hypothetical protein [Pseudobdellovibrionaceae bacterium]